MHQQRSHDRAPERTPAERDDATQAAILSLILALHPIQLTVDELIREMANDPNDFAERDRIQQAVRDLQGAGLIHRYPPFALPTRAAFHADVLASAGRLS